MKLPEEIRVEIQRKGKGEGKGKVSLCLTKHHAMKTYGE
jgi:hypothetical protein